MSPHPYIPMSRRWGSRGRGRLGHSSASHPYQRRVRLFFVLQNPIFSLSPKLQTTHPWPNAVPVPRPPRASGLAMVRGDGDVLRGTSGNQKHWFWKEGNTGNAPWTSPRYLLVVAFDLFQSGQTCLKMPSSILRSGLIGCVMQMISEQC